MGSIEEFLQQYKDREIVYVPNPGNAGDFMIAHGTFQVFNDMGLNWRISKQKKWTDELLFYSGGGNLVGGMYDSCRDFLIKNKDKNEIVVLPHTVANEDALINSLGENIKIICREGTSYKYVRKLMKCKENVFLLDDMALHIKGIEKYKSRKGKGALNCFRTDKEATGIKIPADNADVRDIRARASKGINLPRVKDGQRYDIGEVERISLSVLDYLSKFSVINTNRAHVAIGGSLLNREVNMFSNNYYKNRAIYDYSLKDNYPNTKYEY